ncbi:MAG TPA: amidohydrolase family protein [Ideonella sp.]|uniref:amidohydrolase family protein n=1 Tax=Ideonella sp. TaxID=1929293 RepID=UPI002C1AED2A|nr:amidohydrolase family protein [Ideonella sp.]HSI47610.1 amidohydrolase family protein [Ideonella sp.]
MNRTDAHQHFWRPARGDYGWLQGDEPALAPLRRDFLPEELQPLMLAAGVGKTVLVQAADSVAETEYLLDLASQHDFIAGVVGWVDLSRADAVQTLSRLALHPKFKGVRPMLQDLPEANWICRAPRPEAIAALVSLGLRLDVLVHPLQLPFVLQFLRDWPMLPAVIDHAAKPPLAEGWDAGWVAPWRRLMGEMAQLPNVSCKFSGLMTQLPAAERGSVADAVAALRPLWHELLTLFGPERLMWGSDWPVLTLAGTHADWVSVSQQLIAELLPEAQADVWSRNAQRFYGL